MTEINLTSPADITLKTQGKFCEEDIKVLQNLEEINIYPSEELQEVLPSEGKSGIAKATIQPIQTEVVSVKSTETDTIIDASEGKYIKSINVLPIKLQSKTVRENGKVVADEGFDGLKELEVNVAGSGGGTNGLQWKCDNMKTLFYEFYQCPVSVTSIDEALRGLDTSQVTSMKQMCQYANITSIDLTGLNTGNVTTTENMFGYCSKLVTANLTGLDFGSVTTAKNMFSNCSVFTTVLGGLSLPNATNINGIFSNCSKLEEIDFYNSTGKVTDMGGAFSYCKALKTILNLDMYSMTSNTNMFIQCSALEDLVVKNVRIALSIGGGNYGTKLTVDSLVNTIQELWDYSSGTTTYKLTMGATNLAKLEGVYVKLITPTAEQIANDPYADQKKPCVVCESTDEGAMLITEYATSKNWQLA